MSDLWRHNCGALIDAQPGEVLACPGCGAYVTPAPERTPTEPATGEDVERDWRTVAEIIQTSTASPRVLAQTILAALDLPGREQALRVKVREAEDTIEDYHLAAIRAEAERDDARQRLANVTSALNDLKQANDALHDARDNTARLLEEAREENVWLKARDGVILLVDRNMVRAEVAEEIAVAIEEQDDQGIAEFDLIHQADASIARQHATAEATPDGDGAP